LDERLFFSSNPWRTGGFALPAGTVPRDIQAHAVKLLLKGNEILALLGLRQTGKSTLAFQLIDHLLRREQTAPDRIFYFTFDDLSLRQELSASSGNFLKVLERFLGGEVRGRRDPVYVFVDEVQKLPGFVEYIKMLYDLKLPIRWVLTGSSSLTLKSQVKESLAGSCSCPSSPFPSASCSSDAAIRPRTRRPSANSSSSAGFPTKGRSGKSRRSCFLPGIGS